MFAKNFSRFALLLALTLSHVPPLSGFGGSHRSNRDTGLHENHDPLEEWRVANEIADSILENRGQLQDDPHFAELVNRTTQLCEEIAVAILRRNELPENMPLVQGTALVASFLSGQVYGLMRRLEAERAARQQNRLTMYREVHVRDLRVSGTITVVLDEDAAGIRFSDLHVSVGNRVVMSNESWTAPFRDTLLQIFTDLPDDIDESHIAASVLLLGADFSLRQRAAALGREDTDNAPSDNPEQNQENRAEVG